jgi:hypothetical protein
MHALDLSLPALDAEAQDALALGALLLSRVRRMRDPGHRSKRRSRTWRHALPSIAAPAEACDGATPDEAAPGRFDRRYFW